MPGCVRYEFVNCCSYPGTLSIEAYYVCYRLRSLILSSRCWNHQLSLGLVAIFSMIGLFTVIMLILMNFENDILGADSPSVNNLNWATRERFLLPLLLRQLLLKPVPSRRGRGTLKPLVIIWFFLSEVRCAFMDRDLWIPNRHHFPALSQSEFSASIWLNNPPRVLCCFLKRLEAQFPHGLLNLWHDILRLRLLMSHNHSLIARALWIQSTKLGGVYRSLWIVPVFLNWSLSTKLKGGWRFLFV